MRGNSYLCNMCISIIIYNSSSLRNFTFVAKYFSSTGLCTFRDFGGFCIEFAAICVNSGAVQCISFSLASDILQIFAKYNNNYQNVNSKRLQFTTVYFLTLNVHLTLFLILTSDNLATPTQ
jgi:hypothetical protein